MIIILGIISILLLFYCIYLKHNQIQIKTINKKTEESNQKLEARNKQLKQEYDQAKNNLSEISDTIESQNDVLDSLIDASNKMREDAETRANEYYNSRIKELEANYQERNTQLSAEYNTNREGLNQKIELETQKLQDLESKQLAYIQAQQRQEEIASNQDYYRLAIDELDLNDIKLLRELQPRFFKKESIDKLIWEVYYKPAYDILVAHLFTTSGKTCGIYKITDLTTGQAYIGQSVDIKERFRQHVKSSLTYGKATNKLYQTMQKSGQSNFTFEILEEVSRDKLNERETYWINFYKTKEFGLNSTKGGA